MAKKTKEYDPEVADIMKKMGERFRQLRLARGYTSQEIFAYEKDLNRVQYSRYERGEDIRISTLVTVLKAFDMTIEEFFAKGFE